jgi:hypothetical protein
VKPFQDELRMMLARRFGVPLGRIRKEWQPFKKSPFPQPRVDIAAHSLPEEFARAVHALSADNLSRNGVAATEYEAAKTANAHPRCFAAFEIDDARAPKTFVANALNAAALARFGIAVVSSESALSRAAGILRYWQRIGCAVPSNLLVLTRQQLASLLKTRHDQTKLYEE